MGCKDGDDDDQELILARENGVDPKTLWKRWANYLAEESFKSTDAFGA